MINDYRCIDYNDYRLSTMGLTTIATMRAYTWITRKRWKSYRGASWGENGTKNGRRGYYA